MPRIREGSEIKPGFRIGFRVWWAYTWKMALFIMLLAIPLLGLSLLALLIEDASDVIYLVASCLLIAAPCIIQVLVLKGLLNDSFGWFRVVVSDHEKREIPPDYKIALRVWWSVTWPVFLFDTAVGMLNFFLDPALIAAVYILGIVPLGIWLFKHELSRKYGWFSTAVVMHGQGNQAVPGLPDLNTPKENKLAEEK